MLLESPTLQYFDPFDPALHTDPYTRYARVREAGPLCPGPYGMTVVTRHHDVSAALRNNHLGHGRPCVENRIFSFLGQDPPAHGSLRRLAARFFGPAAIVALTPWIDQFVDDLLGSVLAREKVDLLTDFAYPLSLRVICSLFALPEQDQPWIRAQTPPIGRLLDPPYSIGAADRVAARTAAAGLVAYLQDQIRQRRRRPGPDLLSALIGEVDAGTLARRDLIPMCALLLMAGYETTANIIANAALALIRHPDQVPGVVDGQLDRRALDELLRYDSSIQITFRTVQHETTVAGTVLPVGTPVALLIGSANHDPRVFHRPELLDLGRSPNPHLSFGAGIHYCLGGPLARLEASLALGRLLERTRRLDLAEAEPRHKDITATIRGLDAMPVVLTAR